MREHINRKPIIRKPSIFEKSQTLENATLNSEDNLQNQNESYVEDWNNEISSVKEKLKALDLSGYSEQEATRRNVISSKFRTDTMSYRIDLVLEKASLATEWFLMHEVNRELRDEHGLKNHQISGQVYAKLQQGFVENRDLNDEELAVFAEAGISLGNMKAWRVTDTFKERMKCIREQIEVDSGSQDSEANVFTVGEGGPDEETSNDE